MVMTVDERIMAEFRRIVERETTSVVQLRYASKILVHVVEGEIGVEYAYRLLASI